MEQKMQRNMIKYTSGTMPYKFWKTYIKGNMGKTGLQKLKEHWKKDNIDKDDRNIDYYVINIPNEKEYLFDSLYLLDIGEDTTFYVVYITNINTSSPFAMELSNMDSDEDIEYMASIDDIMKMCSPYNNKEAIKKILYKL
jgi:hypothetical protein